MLSAVLTAIFLFATAATNSIPAGTALPVMVSSTLNAKSAKPGQKIEGKVMQDVAVSAAWTIQKGARVTGHILQVVKAEGSQTLMLKFDQLEDHGQTVRLNVSLRAVASMMSVSQAQMPINSSSDFTAQTDWVTRQIGGDVVNRGRGLVGAPGGNIVGKWTGEGVFGKLTYPLSGSCPGDGADIVQSLWIFSTSACGTYDLSGIIIAQNGASGPAGQIALKFEKKSKLEGGSGWLLVVNGNPLVEKKQN